MLKRTIIALGLAAGMLQAQNLIQNSELDNGMREFYFDGSTAQVKREIVTEASGNKCLSFENLQYRVDKNGKKNTYCACWIGKDGGSIGFKAEPGATYEFQFMYKGKVVPRVDYAEWNGTNFWKNMKRGKVTLEGKLAPSEEWTLAKGTFTVSKEAQHAALHVELSGSEVFKSLPPLGPAFMIDKVQIAKKSPAPAAAK